MQFTSIKFLMFFMIVSVLYYVIPHKLRWVWLLICSYFFYMVLNPKYAILIATSTIITYLSGLLIEKANKISNEKKSIQFKKLWVFASFSSNLGILFLFKYYNFFNESLSHLLHVFSISNHSPSFEYLLPLGISFYTLQALSYTVDVYRKDVPAEKNIGKYALFVSFFPQVVAGPIEKSKNMLHQFDEKHNFNYDRVKNGLLLMLWGVFVKIVVSDRLAVLVNTVYNNPNHYKGFTTFIATLFFSFQIYCDFMSYSDIAKGASEVLGFKVTNNFHQPYLSRSIKEFWSRWHVSLTSWFKDYLYFPLGGNIRGNFRANYNIMIVFIVSGLWHGATFNFIIWGGLHGLYQIVENSTKPLRKRIVKTFKIKTDVFSFKFFQVSITFMLVNFAWIFFKASSLSTAITIIKNIFYFNPWVLINGSIFKLGLDSKDFFIALVGIILVLTVDILRRTKDLRTSLAKQNIMFRWATYVGAAVFILIFGLYGPGYSMQQFIYSQF
ncbi:MBOAT family protein [Clostridium estertheticum]|uniref:MBOAT family O-acyltransferase n=1 Tax=Clostridium estertheticum TaxID=238834 RepID=UPI001C6E61FB|nr:MBOAT family O-acyltransferase [Clostridium estertheticum]MBW9152597.1 MBOAT family protein [Clostridium estertheticum]WLC86180.1 MBOAT family protein [Clostridium estertheticum]